jgi:hypothetical protein
MDRQASARDHGRERQSKDAGHTVRQKLWSAVFLLILLSFSLPLSIHDRIHPLA